MKIAISAGVFAALAVTSAAQANVVQYVTNGDFTSLSKGVGQQNVTTVATGWFVPAGGYTFIYDRADNTGVVGEYGSNTLWDAANGGSNTWDGKSAISGNFAAIDGAFQIQPLTQVISGLIAGKTYNFSFNYGFSQQYGFSGDTLQSLTATIGNDVNYTTPLTALPDHGFSGWSAFSTTFKATSASELLSFVAYGNKPVPPFALVSDVSLTGSVPEPATWTMMILGIGGLGAIARRRRALALAAVAA